MTKCVLTMYYVLLLLWEYYDLYMSRIAPENEKITLSLGSSQYNVHCFVRSYGTKDEKSPKTKTEKKDKKEQKYRQTSLPHCDVNPRKYGGPDLDAVKKIRSSKVVPLPLLYKEPVLLHQGFMQYLFDYKGKRYLDLYAGISTMNIGHSNPKFIKCMYENISTIHHTNSMYLHEHYHTYGEKMLKRLGKTFTKFYFNTTSSESIEVALLLARLHTGNKDVIVLHNSYHGVSYTTSGLTSNKYYKYIEPESQAVLHSMVPDPYRGLWGGEKCRNSLSQVKHRKCKCPENKCKATDYYYNQLEELFRHSMAAKGIAALLIEPIQANGVTQYTKGYLKKAAELVRAKGGVVIVDETHTGFGRTGDLFCFPSECIEPEIVVTGKGMGSGLPISGIYTCDAVGSAIFEAHHSTTFGGNIAAMAAAQVTLDIIEIDKLACNAEKVGEYFLKELEKMSKVFPYMGDVRGRGLMIAVELIDCMKCGDKITRRPMARASVDKIWEQLKNCNILTGRGGIDNNVLIMTPPLCITKPDVDYVLYVLNEALYDHADRLLASGDFKNPD
ncbi:alanine--glyoxylate aminotransferase 2, mitochondrial-like [Ctenocephalides felis]|uniref:alanine--glyoxylate aminotransferase 2, mitochondrial-like n=1 Tax=Ctenocephalides felis TaxID=7515 RepID=UPI000E6E36F1|nr:alanine--glyoxylate aminotransferase 2, mitochondrial-like [Ctenocephalides felis]